VRRPGEKAELVPVPKGQDLHLDPKALQRVRRGLWECVQGPKGTGHGVRLPGIEIAGKTGTAQDPPGQPHGWFASYAPFSTPRYATALIIERGRSGSKSAVPITKALYETLFQVKKKPPATSEAAEEQAHVATH
jgi:penicillin-binding protein 2